MEALLEEERDGSGGGGESGWDGNTQTLIRDLSHLTPSLTTASFPNSSPSCRVQTTPWVPAERTQQLQFFLIINSTQQPVKQLSDMQVFAGTISVNWAED